MPRFDPIHAMARIGFRLAGFGRGVPRLLRKLLRPTSDPRSCPVQANVRAPLSVAEQHQRLREIVARQSEAARSAVSVHRSAEIQLDAAEYGYATMLEDLRAVMRTPVSDWTPERRVPDLPLRPFEPAERPAALAA